jgi:CheY-like chemotaxis protein
MSDSKLLEGKKLLIVDDEADVLETLKELLDMCAVETATDFETAQKLLYQNKYDMAIFDIMGVRGYNLLETATQNGIPALMLTAHALSADDFSKSILSGAKAYIPKEKMADIAIYLTDLLKAQEGKQKPFRWFSRLKSFFESQFGKDWIENYYELKDKYGPFHKD